MQLCTKLFIYYFNLAWLEEDHHLGVEEAPTLIAVLVSLSVVPVVALIAAPLCGAVACARRHKTGMQYV